MNEESNVHRHDHQHHNNLKRLTHGVKDVYQCLSVASLFEQGFFRDRTLLVRTDLAKKNQL